MTASNTSGSAYQPPSSSFIASKQNELDALRLLLAQRRLYSIAKRWALLRIVGISLIAVAAPLITAAAPETSVGLGALAGIWIFLARTVFAGKEQAYSAKGAEVQEQFDSLVFAMPRLALREPRVTLEDISVLVGDDSRALEAAKGESLLDWYPVDEGLSGRDSIAIAQRANAAYSERLLNANANVWLFVTVAWSVLAVALGLILDLDLATFLLGVAAPLLPALLDVYEQWRTTKSAGAERRAMAGGIEKAVRGELGAAVTGEDLLVWQDQLYNLRKRSPQVPNLVYARARAKNGRAMNAAAAALAEAARSRAETDGPGGDA